jgi:Putative transposase
MSSAARIAATAGSPTTPAATAIAPSARARRRGTGWPPARPICYFHLVFTLPAEIAPIAYQNKAVVYDLLFRTAAETLLTIAADPRHLGARIGFTAVLHSWGSAMTHHPHLHIIVPGGGMSFDGARWVPCRPGFFLPVRVLSRLFRRLFLAGLADTYTAGRLASFGELDSLRNKGVPSRPSLRPPRHRYLQGQHCACQGIDRRTDAIGGDASKARRGWHYRHCGGASAAMPLLRRPHDHRRNLRARWRTPRPASARYRGRDRNIMTTLTASLHHPPAGT